MNLKKNKRKINIVVTKLALVIFWALSFNIHSKAQNTSATDDNERKVDYFERIYFSGKNKAGISALYLATIQELDGKSLSPAVQKQYNLLIALKDQVFDAENACEALKIIAVGIFSIDSRTAINQGIEPPTEKQKKKTFDEVSAELTRNVDSSSKINSYAKKGENISEWYRTAIRFIPKKDKPCRDVKPKEIEIGLHPVNTVAANNNSNGIENASESNTISTKITIKNIKYNQLSVLASRFEKIEGIKNVNSDNFSNNTAIIEFTHTLKTKEIIDKVIASNKELKIYVESISADGAILLIK